MKSIIFKPFSMKKSLLFSAFALIALISGCTDSDPKPSEESLYAESGYLLSSDISTSGGTATYVGYFKDLASMKSVDMSKFSTYTTFYSYAQLGNYVYAMSPTGENKFSKLAVDKATGIMKEIGSFPILGRSYYSKVIDENLGFVCLVSSQTVLLFNPTTMQQTGEIDLSKAKKITGNDRQYYNSSAYRASDKKLFLFLNTDNSKTGVYYDDLSIHAEVIDLNTKKWEKSITCPNAMYPISRGKENSTIDEAGNIYVTCQGSYGLDGKLGPVRSTQASRPQIVKILASTNDFDPTYTFNPADKLGQSNLMIQLLGGTTYDANGIAYACVSAAPDSPRVIELITKMAMGTITAQESGELQLLVFYGPSQRWVKLDLTNKTANIIQDIPLTAGFGYPNVFKYDNKFYFQYNDGTQSGYYEYNPATGQAAKAITVTAGGIAAEFIKLSK